MQVEAHKFVQETTVMKTSLLQGEPGSGYRKAKQGMREVVKTVPDRESVDEADRASYE